MTGPIHLEITKDGRLNPYTCHTLAPLDECWPHGMFPFNPRYEMEVHE